MATPSTPYAATLSIDYPDRNLNRLSSFFRLIIVIPIFIILALLIGASTGNNETRNAGWDNQSIATGMVILPTLLMILFRQKYPKWWFDWNLALSRFSARVSAYLLLMRDEYPSTDEEQAVHLDLVYPDAKTLNRWLPLIKWLLAIPHFIVLIFLVVAAVACVIIAWFAILFTGRYPKGLFDFVLGVSRWSLRVEAYALLMLTDQYPPFALT